jgi:hypothetical protein
MPSASIAAAAIGFRVMASSRSCFVVGRRGRRCGLKQIGFRLDRHPFRHCEECSDEAIQSGTESWIASLRSQ